MSKNKMTRGQFLGTSLGLTVLPSFSMEGSKLGRVISSKIDDFELTGQMKVSYETALKILKPTKAQLERGLELRRNSVVFDTYGFMPRAAIDGAAIA